MVKKWFNRSDARAKSKLDWQQIVHPSTPGRSEPKTASSSPEEDWLQSAVPQSIVSSVEIGEIDTPVESYINTTIAAQRRRNSWRWSMLWLTALGICGSVGALALLWLTTLPPPPDCQNITPLTADVERLFCAEQAARSGQVPQLVSALYLVGQWTPDHPLHRESRDLMASWSKTLIAIARRSYNEGNLQKASEVIRQIPASSPEYGNAQQVNAEWRRLWQEGQKIYSVAQTALKQQKWDEASAQLSPLSQVENIYWRQEQLNRLTRQIVVEKQAWQQLTQARQRVQLDQPSALGQAIDLATQVDPKTYTGAIAKAEMTRWSQTLTNIGIQRWRKGDRSGAVMAVQQFPKGYALSPQVKDLLRFGQALDLSSQARSQWQPEIPQIVSLMEAIAAIRQIQPSSSFHIDAQAAIKDWQQQLQDMTQLQFASLTAGVGQKSTFQLAIQQAQTIGAKHPRRLQAQTLIAHWGQEIQRIEDRPIIARARRLAQPGTLPTLRAAIAEASQVQLGRALRGEAQTNIAQWNNQIEVIEDRPILDEAKAVARRGRLSRAIDIAGKIGADRALYAEARSAIRGWRAEIRRIQVAQDQSILDEARSLASIDSLTLAIEKASQITSDRPLYRVAQSEIAAWAVRRQEIWDSWAAPQDDYYDDGYYDDGSDQGYEQPY